MKNDKTNEMCKYNLFEKWVKRIKMEIILHA